MSTLEIRPFGGINKRMPRHKIASTKIQKVRELRNLLSLDGRIALIDGASRYQSTAIAGDVKWLKRIYYTESGDKKRFLFTVINGKMYRGNENDDTLAQMKISESLDTSINSNFYPIDATMKVSGNVSTFIVDGTYFYKFNGNSAGAWERLPIKNDVDGNPIKPIFICEYLDRLFVLSKDENRIYYSKNRTPEVYDDSTDAGFIQIPPGNGGYPVGLIVHRGFLFVIHEDYFSPVSGSSPSSFGVAPGDIIHGFGTRAPRSIVSDGKQFAFLNSEDNEFYTTSGTLDSTKLISYEINMASLINPVLAHLTIGFHDPKIAAFRFSYVHTGEYNTNWEVIYDLNNEVWCGETEERHISSYCLWNGNGDQGELYTGRSDTGVIMRNRSGINFDDTAIHYKFVTADYIMSDIKDVQIENIYVDVKSLGNFGIPFTYYMNGRLTTYATESVNMQGEVLTLGLIEIGDQDFFLNSFTPYLDYSKGKTIRFQCEETQLNRLFELYAIFCTVNVDTEMYDKFIAGR